VSAKLECFELHEVLYCPADTDTQTDTQT